jgi:hypothetical protein
MGHTLYSTTQRYLHHQPRREDAAKLAEAFSATGQAGAGTEAGTNMPKSNGAQRHTTAPTAALQHCIDAPRTIF